MDFLARYEVCDKLRIDNSNSHVTEKGVTYFLHPVTITSQQCYRTLDEFRKQVYEKCKNFCLVACCEYHERSWKVHAHGYVLLPDDLSNTVDCRLHKKVPYLFKADGFNIVCEDACRTLDGHKGWELYCLKQAQYTLEQNNDTTIGLFDKFYKYGKRRKWIGE